MQIFRDSQKRGLPHDDKPLFLHILGAGSPRASPYKLFLNSETCEDGVDVAEHLLDVEAAFDFFGCHVFRDVFVVFFRFSRKSSPSSQRFMALR